MYGKRLVAKILGRLGKKERNGVLEYIDRRDPPLAKELKERMVTLETLFSLREREIALLQQQLEIGDIARALKTASEALKEKLLSGLSRHKREMIEEEQILLGAVKKSEIEAAEGRIVEALRVLIEKGEVSPGEEWIE